MPTGLLLVGSHGSYTISGTPSGGAGTFTFQINATDVDGNTGYRPYTFNTGTAGGMAVNPGALPNGYFNTAYSQNITGSGGTGPYTFSVISGSLPNGLSLTSGGLLSGTATAGGAFTFTVQGNDSAGNTGTQNYTVHIGTNSLTILPATLPNGSIGVAYSQTLTATGGSGTGQVFSISAGALPTGLSINAAGDITGTPSAAGTYNFTVSVVDSYNNTGSRAYSITVGANILTVTPPTLPAGSVGTPYSQNFGATGGNGNYSFALTSGTLPNGLSLTAGGALTGTPTVNGTFNFGITATDTNFNTGTRSYSVIINLAPLTINPATLPAGTVGTVYSSGVTASGGSGNYSYAVVSGALPGGLSMNPGTGAITGTPSGNGAFSFTVQATDNTTPNTGTRAYTVNIGSNVLTVTPPILANGTQGTAYSATFGATGGTGPYVFALNSGSLPAGLSLSAGGAITGTPSGSGTSSFTVRATDSLGNVGTGNYTLNIGTNALTVAPANLAAGTQNVPYSGTVTASGGNGGPYTFAISGGALPAGLTMNAAGVISGTPTGSGAASFTVRALDTAGNIGTHLYAMNIGTVTLTVNPATLPDAVFGRAYSQTVTATGGTTPYTFSITAGALPAGLTLNAATGVISGTPTAAGNDAFTVQARDVNGNIGSRAYTMDPRPDPATDPEVQGLILAQVASAQRFASAQVNNVARHLESLHSDFTPCSFNFGIAPPMSPAGPPANGDYANPNSLYSPSGTYGAPVVVLPPGYAPPPGYVSHQMPDGRSVLPATRDCAADWASSMAFWTAGSFEFGSMTPSGLTSSNKFNTAGLTAGVDYRITEKLIVGAAIGYGADRTDVGSNSTRSDGTSFTGMLYASLRPFDPLFIDGAIGYGTLGYDNRRWVTGENTTVSGTRDGSYFFGSLAASVELGRGRFKFAPYISTDFMSATLNGYSESGPSASLLTFNQMKFNAISGAVGLRGSIDIPVSFGILTPNARVEYRQTSQSAFDQSMYYTDLGSGSASTFSQPVGSQGATTGAIGIRARAPGGLAVEMEYGVTGGSGSLLTQSLRAAVKMPF